MRRLRRPLTLIFNLALSHSLIASGVSTSGASLAVRSVSHGPIRAFQNDRDEYFEGKYRVGRTTCIVTPVKMAFEVKWARGKGVMLFFFDSKTPEGQFSYVSEDKGAGRDRFIFDNGRFNSGKFIRADGKQFLVKKFKRQKG